MGGNSQMSAPSSGGSPVGQSIMSLLGNQGTNDPMGPNLPPSGFSGGLFGNGQSGMGGASDFGQVIGQLLRQRFQQSSSPTARLGIGQGGIGQQRPQIPMAQAPDQSQGQSNLGSIASLLALFA